MRISSRLLPQCIALPGIVLALMLGEVCLADSPGTTQLDSRYQQQEKRRLDLLQKQQKQGGTVRLQPDVNQTDYPAEPEQPCFVIDEIRLIGVQAERFSFSLEHVLRQEPTVIGRCLGVNGINTVSSRVQNQIIKAGYVTTRILVEPQDIRSGVLTLTVIPGTVNTVKLSGDAASPTIITSSVPVKEGELLNLRDIEQAVENMRRVPTVAAEVDIVPAEGNDATPGQSDLLIHHSQTKPFRLTLSVDDSGYDATGRYQGAATLSLDNPLGLSDLFYASFNTELGHAENDGGTDGYSLHYSAPYRYWLFSATTSEHEYWQNVAGLNQSYEYRGKSRRHEVGFSRVVYRDSNSKLKLGLQAYKTSSRNFIEDTEIEVQQRRMAGWVAQLNYQLFIEKAAFDFGLAWQRGTGAFDTLPAPEEAFDEGTSRPKIITANLNVNYPFELASQKFNFNSYWEAQWNKTPLVPQDRFSIGGRYTVRGFDGESTLLAERGWLSRNTVSMRMGETQHQLYTGIDVGHVSGQSADLLLGQRLAGWGVGIKGHWNGIFYDLFAGTPLDKPDGFEAGRTLGFNLTYQY